MDITSYLLGKKAGGGSPTPPSLQEKNVTITENTTTNVLPDIGYDGLSKVSITTNVAGGGGDLDWSAIGYDSTPESIVDGYNYAKYIQENWVDNTSTLGSDFSSVIICPLVSLGNRTSCYNFAYECKSLIEIPLLDTSNVTNMDSMFQYCSALTEIPLLNTSNVTSMQSMFQYCSSLKSIPQINISNVTSFANTFRYCTNLMTLPVLNTSKVTNFNNAFGNSYNLTDTSLDNILQMCINATSYTGTKTLKTLGISNTTYYPVSRIEALPHYQDFINAGWTKGY